MMVDGKTHVLPAVRPVSLTILPALSTAPPTAEPAAATPDFIALEIDSMMFNH